MNPNLQAGFLLLWLTSMSGPVVAGGGIVLDVDPSKLPGAAVKAAARGGARGAESLPMVNRGNKISIDGGVYSALGVFTPLI
jgi:hypothetical protein